MKYEPEYPRFVDKSLKDLYVDDVTSGANTVTEGKEFYDLAKSIMLKVGFDLQKWVTNESCKNVLMRKKTYFLRIIVLQRNASKVCRE